MEKGSYVLPGHVGSRQTQKWRGLRAGDALDVLPPLDFCQLVTVTKTEECI